MSVCLDMSLALIERRVPPYGLAPARWREQLAALRALPEYDGRRP